MNSESKCFVIISCQKCRRELNRSVEMTPQQVSQRWTKLVLSAGFVSLGCPSGCRPTFSDLNINTNLILECDGKVVEFEDIKAFLTGDPHAAVN